MKYVVLTILILWFQFGADLFERYQFNQCRESLEKNGKESRSFGVSFTPWIVLPGNFVLLNIRLAEDCEE